MHNPSSGEQIKKVLARSGSMSTGRSFHARERPVGLHKTLASKPFHRAPAGTEKRSAELHKKTANDHQPFQKKEGNPHRKLFDDEADTKENLSRNPLSVNA